MKISYDYFLIIIIIKGQWPYRAATILTSDLKSVTPITYITMLLWPLNVKEINYDTFCQLLGSNPGPFDL